MESQWKTKWPQNKVILDHPGGPNTIKRVLKCGRGKQGRSEKDLEREGTISQGMPLEAGEEMESLREPAGRNRALPTPRLEPTGSEFGR